MSFSIPPSPEPDRDWALVPGNHTDFYHASIFEPSAQGMQAKSRNKLVVTDMAAFGGFCSMGGDAGCIQKHRR